MIDEICEWKVIEFLTRNYKYLPNVLSIFILICEHTILIFWCYPIFEKQSKVTSTVQLKPNFNINHIFKIIVDLSIVILYTKNNLHILIKKNIFSTYARYK